jgi:hypothetical protein
MDNFIHRLTKFIKISNIYVLVDSAVVIPVILIIVWAFIGEKIYNGTIPERLTYMLIASCSLLSSLGGLVQIIRKESPGILGIPCSANLGSKGSLSYALSPINLSGFASTNRFSSVSSTSRTSCGEALPTDMATGKPAPSATAMSFVPLPRLVFPTPGPPF